ncbi:MAG: ABC transporter permease subunit, partial [Longimicrobiales bacterium]
FYDVLSLSWLARQFRRTIAHPISERIDAVLTRALKREVLIANPMQRERPSLLVWVVGGALVIALAVLGVQAAGLLATLPAGEWARIGIGLLSTFLRVTVSLIIATAWTIPVGVWIGSNRRVAAVLQPIVQVVASIPATALFPVIVLALVNVTGGLNVAAVLLMLLGTQWYLLFNVIAGASAIPQDLTYTTELLQVKGWARWRTLILPALFPYLITGMITAGGGAWNASIVAEHIQFGGETLTTTGVGALIAEGTATGNYALLLASTLSLITAVVAINRFFWRRLYAIAEEKYRME